MLDKRQYFAENVGYEIPLLIPGIFFITILSALAALISAVHVQRRGLGGGGGYSHWAETRELTPHSQSSVLTARSFKTASLTARAYRLTLLSPRSQSKAAAAGWLYLLVQSARSSNLELESQYDAVLCKLVECELNISRSSSSKISITKKITWPSLTYLKTIMMNFKTNVASLTVTTVISVHLITLFRVLSWICPNDVVYGLNSGYHINWNWKTNFTKLATFNKFFRQFITVIIYFKSWVYNKRWRYHELVQPFSHTYFSFIIIIKNHNNYKNILYYNPKDLQTKESFIFIYVEERTT